MSIKKNSVETLQEVIDKRAHDKLYNEIEWLINHMQQSSLFNSLSDFEIQVKNSNGAWEGTHLKNIFWSSTSQVGNFLHKFHINRYTKNETKEFVEEIDSLKQKVNELESNISSINNKYD